MPPSLFSQAMQLRQSGDGTFHGELGRHWTIGPKVHGGALLALCAAAARGLAAPPAEPVAISASYLSAPAPGQQGA